MINYVKSLNVKSEDLMALSNCPWNNENYLKPSDMAFLPWLTFGRNTANIFKNLGFNLDNVHYRF